MSNKSSTPKCASTFEDILSYFTLNAVPNIGVLGLHSSAARLDCELTALAQQEAKNLHKIGWSAAQIQSLKNPNVNTRRDAQRTFNWLNSNNNRYFIAYHSSLYPDLLKTIASPPLYLFAKGNIDLLAIPSLAIVGTRQPSHYAMDICESLIKDLSVHCKVTTVSGLALGIDGICHKVSLHNDVPTIGVLGCGIDVIYPKRHKALFEQLAEQGLLLSEYPLGSSPKAHMFPRRNRLISGLSLGTLVIEANIKSGSLITAKYALEQNREVFAVPNNVFSQSSEGCHYLIKQGAKLTETYQDICDELPSIVIRKPVNLQKNEKKCSESLASDPLLDSVNYSATSLDVIAERTGLSISELLTQLLEYEMRGLITSTADGYVKLRG